MIRIERLKSLGTDNVKVTMSRADAEQLFHDVNLMMTFVDEFDPGIETGHAGQELHDAYHRANAFLAQMQQDLKIEPEEPR